MAPRMAMSVRSRTSGRNSSVEAASTAAVPATSSSCPDRTSPAPRAPAAVSPSPDATDHRRGFDDPGQLVRRDTYLLGELARPHASARFGEPREVEVRRVDKGVAGLKAGDLASDVPTRHDPLLGSGEGL